jgi:hypothetical protein
MTLPATAVAAGAPDWVVKSDENTAIVTAVFAEYLPELMGASGVSGIDERITHLSLERDAKAVADEKRVLEILRRKLDKEEHPAVRQDLEILIDTVQRDLEMTELEQRLMLPYFDVSEQVFRGLRALLDDQVPEERRAAALVRLRRYTGLEEGYTSLTLQAEAYTRARLDDPGLLGPFREKVEKDLARAPRLLEGLRELLATYGPAGHEEAYEALGRQLDAYHAFVRQEILPRSRDDYRVPAELYALELQDLGVDMPIDELASRAKVAFKEIQNEMGALAALVARAHELPSTDYRDVLRELKKDQLVGEAILTRYAKRIEQIEAIIARERIVSLPEREMRLRLASEAEAAMVQAATIRWPQLLGEAAEVGEIILPLRRASSDGSADMAIDDFTFDAAAWSLVAHEGRPGHELQMAAMLERGVSKARAFFAFNSTNVEGWALYVESELKPYLPLDAQLVSLQHRLLRAARAFLDPGLQLGQVTRGEAMRVLTEDVVISVALAEQELERYTTRSPGQATSYFCGYTRLLELRADAERMLGDDFDRRAFNDFILDQGLLPPSLLRKAVIEEFVTESSSCL